MRTLIWAAVSSRPQANDDKDSIPDQITRARDYVASREGWREIHEPLVIPGHTRRYTFLLDACEDMPQYAALMRLARQGEIDLVICRSRDRLGRTDSLIATLEQYLSDCNVQILSLDMPTRIVEPDSYARRKDRAAVWMRSVERAKAQTEVLELQERYRLGMHGRIRQGLHPNNKVPFGYRLDRGVGVPYEPEADIIRSIYNWYLQGASYQDIIDRYGFSSKSRVAYLLTNRYYCGYVSFSRRGLESDDPPMGRGQHEPIISEEGWQAVQEEMRRRRGEGQRSPYTKHPLSGFVYCGYCGESMVMDSGISKGRRYRYYRCGASDCPRPTPRNSIRADHLEGIVADEILRWITGPKGIEAIKRYLARYEAESVERARGNARSASKKIAQKKAALKQWRSDYEAGLIKRHEYYDHRERLTKETKALEDALKTAQRTLRSVGPQEIQDLSDQLVGEEPGQLAENMRLHPQVVKATLRRIGFRATHTDGHVEISLQP